MLKLYIKINKYINKVREKKKVKLNRQKYTHAHKFMLVVNTE